MTHPPFVAAALVHEAACRALAAELQIGWTWDAVYCAASASIDSESIAGVAARLARALPQDIDRRALPSASARMQDLAMWAGGLQGRQRLFVADPAEGQGVALFAALWPWTEDDGCTVRVGLWHPDATIVDRAALGAALVGWFGLPSSA